MNLVWIAGYGGPVAGAAPVWIAPGDGSVPSAVASAIAGYGGGASPVWIAGYGGPGAAAIGATPISIGGYGAASGGGTAIPVNTVAPVATGSLTIGSTLSCTTGTWTNSPTSYAYQWRRGGVNISGATASTYVTVTADGGTSVGCVVVATNAGGNSGAVASNTLAITAPATSVWSASDAATNSLTLTNGGLTVASSGVSSFQTIRGSIGRSAGLLYVEFAAGATISSAQPNSGLASSGFNPVGYLGQTNYSVGIYMYSNSTDPSPAGFTSHYNPGTAASSATDVIALAVNFTTGNMWVALNNVWNNGSNPATGTLPIASFVQATVGTLFPAFTFYGTGCGTWTLQPNAASQKYAPPSGFSPWN